MAIGSGVDAFTTPTAFSPLNAQSTALTSRFPIQVNNDKATAATSCALFSRQASGGDSLSSNKVNGINVVMKRVSRFFLLVATAFTMFASGWTASAPATHASSMAPPSTEHIYQTAPVSAQKLTPKQKALRMQQLRLKQQRQQKIQNLTPAQRRKLLQKRQKILQQQQQASYPAVNTNAGYYGQPPPQQQYYPVHHHRAAPNRLTSFAAGSVKVGILAVAVSAAVMIGSKGLAGDLRERLGSLLAPRSRRRDNNNEVSPTSRTRTKPTAAPSSRTITGNTGQRSQAVRQDIMPASSGRILPDSDESTAFLVMKKADTDPPNDIVFDHDDHNYGVLAYQNDDDTHGYLTHQGPPLEERDPYMNDQIIPERDGDLAEPFESPIKMIQPNDDGRKVNPTLYRQNQFNGQVPFEQAYELQGDSDTILNHMHASRSREEPSETTVRRPRAPGSMLRKSEDDNYYQQLEQQQQEARRSPQMLGLARRSSQRRPTESLLSRARTETSQPLAISKSAYINTATDDSSRHFALSYMFNKFLAKKMRNPAFDSDNTRRISGAQTSGGFEEGHAKMRRNLLP